MKIKKSTTISIHNIYIHGYNLINALTQFAAEKKIRKAHTAYITMYRIVDITMLSYGIWCRDDFKNTFNLCFSLNKSQQRKNCNMYAVAV